jgi:hypothetical protein
MRTITIAHRAGSSSNSARFFLIGFSIAVDLFAAPTIYSIMSQCGVSEIR